MEWEGTLESVETVETLAEDTVVFHQLHKRVWPSTQRESLFCSHLCTLNGAPRPENMIGHTWMVCNFSMDHDSVPVNISHLASIIVECILVLSYEIIAYNLIECLRSIVQGWYS